MFDSSNPYKPGMTLKKLGARPYSDMIDGFKFEWNGDNKTYEYGVTGYSMDTIDFGADQIGSVKVCWGN